MNPTYTIITDSGCDMPVETLESWGVPCADLTFRFDGEDHDYNNREMSASEFYARMKAGGLSRTSAVTPADFHRLFEAELKQGKDVLYLGFSGGLSNTPNAGKMAAKELAEEYPERKILAYDTLCASSGQGLVVLDAVEQRDAGASIEDCAAHAMALAPKIAHWVTVDDLVYLKRGGRISAATALLGGALGIKPIIHVDDKGCLDSVDKKRGRKAAMKALVEKYFETSIGGHYIIAHGDCLEEAKAMEAMIAEKTGQKAVQITDVGPVIGSHTGPGVLVLLFPATAR